MGKYKKKLPKQGVKLMRLYYRYDNIVREILTKDEISATYYGTIIPASIAIYYKKSVSAFLGDYQKPYFIDPMTYFINQPIKNISNRQKKARRSYKMLIQEYLGFDVEEIDNIHIQEENIWDLSEADMDLFCRNVLNFQTECFQDSEVLDFINEYLEEEQQQNTPELLIAPYVLIEDENTYEFNRRCIRTAFRNYEGEVPLFACITISKDYLGRNPNLEERILEDFSFVNNFILWVSAFNAIDESVKNLLRFKNIVRILSDNARNTIINLYGDYFSLLLSKFGLNGFSSGLRGGTKKTARLRKGGGGRVTTNVYVPQLRRFILEEDFRVGIQRDERLICNCIKCEEIMENQLREDPFYLEAFANDLMDEKRYLVHFLFCRNEENLNLEDADLDDLLNDLREKSELYNTNSFSGHLLNWLEDL